VRDTFVQTLLEEAKTDPNVILITGDLGFGVLEKFETALPNQYMNAGVAEQSMLGLAAGMASTGKRVFTYSIGNFPTIRALEQIRNDVCYMNNPVVIVSVGSGYSYGSQGYTHHALEDIAVMRALPGLNVVTPADPYETVAITQYLAKDRKPAYLRLGRSGEKQINSEIPRIREGFLNPIVLGKQGSIIFSGSIGVNVMVARDVLLGENIDIGVYSAPFISMLKPESLAEVLRRGPVLTVEEHSMRGGLGSSILELASTHNLVGRIKMLGASQRDLAQIGEQDYLRQENGLGVQSIVKGIMELLVN
jgi:transketolase